jgi:hypothetical protein
MLIAIVMIWASVALISIFSPDLVSGSEQQHLPVAAFSTWLWGAGATTAVLVAVVRLAARRGDQAYSAVVAGTTAVLWLAAVPVSVFAPSMQTGSDPTTIPLAALVAPMVAAAGAVLVAVAVTIAERLGGAD